jgi:Tol biopolymer transport system component
LLGIAFLMAAVPAQAAFPGRNGHLAGSISYCDDYDEESPSCLSWTDLLRVFRPGGRPVEPPLAYAAGGLSWSPDGLRAAVSLRFVEDWQDQSEGPTPGVHVVESSFVTTTAHPPSPPGPLIVPTGEPMDTAWAPDGERLVVSGSPGLQVVDRSGVVLRQLPVPDGFAADAPAWSAGDRIAFSAHRWARGRLRGGVFTMNPDGSGLERLTHRPGFDADWAPFGRRLAFARGGRVLVVGADGTGLRPVARGADPVWSPDGRWIAFTRRMPLACAGQLSPRMVFRVRASGGMARAVRVDGPRTRVCVDRLDGWQPLR